MVIGTPKPPRNRGIQFNCLKLLIFSVITFFYGVSAPLLADTPVHPLEKLRSIRNQAHSLASFLTNPVVIDTYFAELQAYFGSSKVDRRDFDEVIKHLKDISQAVPEIKARLWADLMTAPPIALTTTLKSYGRDIVSFRWSDFKNTWLRTLKREAHAFYAMDNEHARHEKIKKVLRDAVSRTRKFFQMTQRDFKRNFRATARKSGMKRGRMEQELKQAWHQEVMAFKTQLRQQVDPALSYLVHAYFSQENIQDRTNAGADSVLDVFEQFSKHPAEELSKLEIIDLGTLRALKSQFREEAWDFEARKGFFPQLKDLLGNETMFPKQTVTLEDGRVIDVDPMASATYVFRATQPFEALWKSFLIDECTRTHPRRFLTAALQGAKTFYVERSVIVKSNTEKSTVPKIVGFTLLVPVKHKQTGNIVTSVDFGAALLGSDGVFQLKDPEDQVRVPLGVMWMHHYRRTSPQTRFAIGQSNSGDNSGVQQKLRQHVEYLLGTDAGLSTEFMIPDPLVDKIVTATPDPPDRELANRYTPDMMFDVRLKTPTDGGAHNEEKNSITEFRLVNLRQRKALLTDPQVLISIMNPSDVAYCVKILKFLAHRFPDHLKAQAAIANHVQHENKQIALAAIEASKTLPKASIGVFVQLNRARRDPRQEIRDAATTALLHLKPSDLAAIQTVARDLEARSVELRRGAIRILTAWPVENPSIRHRVFAQLGDSDKDVVLEALRFCVAQQVELTPDQRPLFDSVFFKNDMRLLQPMIEEATRTGWCPDTCDPIATFIGRNPHLGTVFFDMMAHRKKPVRHIGRCMLDHSGMLPEDTKHMHIVPNNASWLRRKWVLGTIKRLFSQIRSENLTPAVLKLIKFASRRKESLLSEFAINWLRGLLISDNRLQITQHPIVIRRLMALYKRSKDVQVSSAPYKLRESIYWVLMEHLDAAKDLDLSLIKWAIQVAPYEGWYSWKVITKTLTHHTHDPNIAVLLQFIQNAFKTQRDPIPHDSDGEAFYQALTQIALSRPMLGPTVADIIIRAIANTEYKDYRTRLEEILRTLIQTFQARLLRLFAERTGSCH